jgi:hypothetical protein
MRTTPSSAADFDLNLVVAGKNRQQPSMMLLASWHKENVMQIHDQFDGPRLPGVPQAKQREVEADKKPPVPAVVEAQPLATSQAPVEAAALIRVLQDQPEVRSDVVDRARAKLAAGDLLTPAAAKQVAAAFLSQG